MDNHTNNNLIRRTLSTAISLIAVWFIIYIFPNWIFGIIAAGIAMVALYEFFTMVEKKGILIYKYFGILLGLFIFFTVYGEYEPTKGIELLFMVTAFIALFVLQFIRRDNSQAIAGISTTIFGVVYIGWLFSFIMKIKILPYGPYIVTFLILVAKLGDIGAYIVGTIFGRHSLIARISPKKTVEGAVGGFIFSLLIAMLSKFYLPHIPFFHLVILGCLLGVLAQLGDVSESLIKRDCQVKDSGSLLPGLGGFLDIIDSLLFTTPILYFYIRLFL